MYLSRICDVVSSLCPLMCLTTTESRAKISPVKIYLSSLAGRYPFEGGDSVVQVFNTLYISDS